MSRAVRQLVAPVEYATTHCVDAMSMRHHTERVWLGSISALRLVPPRYLHAAGGTPPHAPLAKCALLSRPHQAR